MGRKGIESTSQFGHQGETPVPTKTATASKTPTRAVHRPIISSPVHDSGVLV